MREQLIALVAAFNESGEVLLLKRPDDVHCGRLWSLPGGKLEDGETPLDAARRELREETRLAGSQWRHLGTAEHVYASGRLHFHVFRCQAQRIGSMDCETEHVWVHPDAFGLYPMPAANRKILPLLQGPADHNARSSS